MGQAKEYDGVQFVVGHIYEYAGYEFELKEFVNSNSANFIFMKDGAGYKTGQTIELGFGGRWQHKGPGINIDPKNIHGLRLLDKEW